VPRGGVWFLGIRRKRTLRLYPEGGRIKEKNFFYPLATQPGKFKLERKLGKGYLKEERALNYPPRRREKNNRRRETKRKSGQGFIKILPHANRRGGEIREKKIKYFQGGNRRASLEKIRKEREKIPCPGETGYENYLFKTKRMKGERGIFGFHTGGVRPGGRGGDRSSTARRRSEEAKEKCRAQGSLKYAGGRDPPFTVPLEGAIGGDKSTLKKQRRLMITRWERKRFHGVKETSRKACHGTPKGRVGKK